MYAPDITKEYDVEEPNEAWVKAIEEVYEDCNINIPLHVWEHGFEQGDASNEEVEALAKAHGVTVDALFNMLNVVLENKYRSNLREALVSENEEE
jgi:hypothetical protein